MNKYEVMFIVNPTLEQDAIKKTADLVSDTITKAKGKVLELNDMGQKELAYEIKKHKNGYYYLLTFEADKEAIDKLNHVANVNENILRHMVIKLEK